MTDTDTFAVSRSIARGHYDDPDARRAAILDTVDRFLDNRPDAPAIRLYWSYWQNTAERAVTDPDWDRAILRIDDLPIAPVRFPNLWLNDARPSGTLTTPEPEPWPERFFTAAFAAVLILTLAAAVTVILVIAG